MVRGDGKLNRSIRDARSWRNSSFDAELEEEAGSKLAWKIGLSFSGKERNKLFFSRKAEQFVDLSTISGLDNVADSRVLALWDFDRDGWQDMAVANANAPLLNIYRNEIGEAESSASSTGQIIAIRFVGGSHTAQPSKQFSCRDGYGAKVRVTTGEFSLLREHHCGEGMAGQNSGTMIIGIGENNVAKSVNIRWPSGIEQQVHDVTAGTLVTVYEDPAQAPGESAAQREPYVVPSNTQWRRDNSKEYTAAPKFFQNGVVDVTHPNSTLRPKILLYTTMATWCEACKNHLPQLQQLRSKLNPELLGMYGVPIDVEDDSNKLSSYAEHYQPAYELLTDLPDDQRKQVEQLVSDTLKVDALPSTIIIDLHNNIRLITAGLPTVSQLKKIIQSE